MENLNAKIEELKKDILFWENAESELPKDAPKEKRDNLGQKLDAKYAQLRELKKALK